MVASSFLLRKRAAGLLKDLVPARTTRLVSLKRRQSMPSLLALSARYSPSPSEGEVRPSRPLMLGLRRSPSIRRTCFPSLARERAVLAARELLPSEGTELVKVMTLSSSFRARVSFSRRSRKDSQKAEAESCRVMSRPADLFCLRCFTLTEGIWPRQGRFTRFLMSLELSTVRRMDASRSRTARPARRPIMALLATLLRQTKLL